jgi:hypothetical protein
VRERIDLLCRTRTDGRLCRPAPAGSRRVYSEETFTSEQIKKDDSIAWQKSPLGPGNRGRELRYKEQRGVLWQTGADPRRLRLLVVAPIPYRRTKTSRLYDRRPAFLRTTDLTTPTRELWQVYLDRWEIEANHREEKTTLGVGQAQLWSTKSIGRQPALVVAADSALLLAGWEA